MSEVEVETAVVEDAAAAVVAEAVAVITGEELVAATEPTEPTEPTGTAAAAEQAPAKPKRKPYVPSELPGFIEENGRRLYRFNGRYPQAQELVPASVVQVGDSIGVTGQMLRAESTAQRYILRRVTELQVNTDGSITFTLTAAGVVTFQAADNVIRIAEAARTATAGPALEYSIANGSDANALELAGDKFSPVAASGIKPRSRVAIAVTGDGKLLRLQSSKVAAITEKENGTLLVSFVANRPSAELLPTDTVLVKVMPPVDWTAVYAARDRNKAAKKAEAEAAAAEAAAIPNPAPVE